MLTTLFSLVFLLQTPVDSPESSEPVPDAEQANDSRAYDEPEKFVCMERCHGPDELPPPIEPNQRNHGCALQDTGNSPALLLVAAGGLLVARRRRRH